MAEYAGYTHTLMLKETPLTEPYQQIADAIKRDYRIWSTEKLNILINRAKQETQLMFGCENIAQTLSIARDLAEMYVAMENDGNCVWTVPGAIYPLVLKRKQRNQYSCVLIKTNSKSIPKGQERETIMSRIKRAVYMHCQKTGADPAEFTWEQFKRLPDEICSMFQFYKIATFINMDGFVMNETDKVINA